MKARKYNEKFRMRMVQRMVGPNGISARRLSEEVGVAQSTLSRWLKRAGTVSSMKRQDVGSGGTTRPVEKWTAEERLKALLEFDGLSDESARGAFLRAHGLHEVVLDAWREAALGALRPGKKRRRGRTPLQKEVRQLRGELARKDKALAETAALLVLQGKARALWGEEGASTPSKSDRKRSR